MGKIHAARIRDSKRHQRIIELLQEAYHPLSSQDIAKAAYPNSDDIMLNVSTNIGEMRSEENQADGYIVSFSTYWRIGKDPGRKVNKDDSVTFVMPEAKYLWHDGRPRYWLIAAPGWSPRWLVSEEGLILPCTAGHIVIRGQGSGISEEKKSELCTIVENDERKTGPGTPCRLPRCGRPIPDDKRDDEEFCCDSHRLEFWKDVREIGKKSMALQQGSLF